MVTLSWQLAAIATEQICLVGVELPTSVCTCIIWIILTLLLNIWLYCLGVYLASLLLTHQVPDGSRHSRSGVSGLNPGSLGWLWTVSGEDHVWDDSL